MLQTARVGIICVTLLLECVFINSCEVERYRRSRFLSSVDAMAVHIV